MAEEKLLTPEEVSDRLRVSRWTVMDYLRAGRIKGRKVGRLWRITERDLQAFIEGLAMERPSFHPEPAAKEGL